MSQMLTVSDASALLLVGSGVGVLVLLCCAALIWARTHFAPHSDCKVALSAMDLKLDDVIGRQKKIQKSSSGQQGGRPRSPVEQESAPSLLSEGATGRLSDTDLQKAAHNRLQGILNGRQS